MGENTHSSRGVEVVAGAEMGAGAPGGGWGIRAGNKLEISGEKAGKKQGRRCGNGPWDGAETNPETSPETGGNGRGKGKGKRGEI